jgi:hypothetical protein
MSTIDPDFIRHLVANTQGITLQDPASERLAAILGHALATLDALAGGGLFDTEPASFDRMLTDAADSHDV